MEILITCGNFVLLAAAAIFYWYQRKGMMARLEASGEEVAKKEKEVKNAVDDLTKMKARIENLEKTFDENLQKKVQIERERIEQAIEKEYNDALEEQKKVFEAQVQEVDEMLGKRMEEIAATNTLTFRCTCDKTHRIPVQIDFTKENRFTCDKCGSVYRVEINSYPVLLSNVSTNKTLANILEKNNQQ